MGIRGIDISNYQAGMDLERVIRENNIDFVFIQSNDGTFKNVHFREQLDAARSAGALVAAYMYQRPNWQQTVDTFKSIVPVDVPAIVDVEDGSGSAPEARKIHESLWASGYKTPVIYFPKWYWDKVGQPSLVGLPPLWKSWYANNLIDSYENHLSKVPSSVWNGHGGLTVEILQFSGTGKLNGYNGNVDLNYFPGSREELANILGQEAEEDMATAQEIAKAVWEYQLSSLVGEPDEKGEYGSWTTSAGNALSSSWAQIFNATGVYGPSLAAGLGTVLNDLENLAGTVPGGGEIPSKDEILAAIEAAIEKAFKDRIRVVGSLQVEARPDGSGGV